MTSVDRKFHFFLSSPFLSLKEFRAAAIKAVLSAGHIPIVMEYQAPETSEVKADISNEISRADFVVLLLSPNIGSRPKESHFSFIQYEFEQACQFQKPMLLYEINSESINEDSFSEEFKKLRKEMRDHSEVRSYGSFNDKTIDTFASNIERAIINQGKLKEQSKTGGYVDASLYDEISDALYIKSPYSSISFYRRYIDSFNEFGRINRRLIKESQLKTSIGRYLVQFMMPHIDTEGINTLFFESGSAVAYASEAFLGHASETQAFASSKVAQRLRIVTNNFFTLADFTLFQSPTKPFRHLWLCPQPPFSLRTAATYGEILETHRYEPSFFAHQDGTIPEDAERAIKKTTNEIRKVLIRPENLESPCKALLIQTATGIDWSGENERQYIGPHVREYHDMLFKRSNSNL